MQARLRLLAWLLCWMGQVAVMHWIGKLLGVFVSRGRKCGRPAMGYHAQRSAAAIRFEAYWMGMEGT